MINESDHKALREFVDSPVWTKLCRHVEQSHYVYIAGESRSADQSALSLAVLHGIAEFRRAAESLAKNIPPPKPVLPAQLHKKQK